jgi:YgiT-type zinc finger domain-containing protein
MKKTKKRPQPASGNGCPSCGTAMKERRGRLSLPVNGEEMKVPGALHLRCPKCGEVVLRFEESRRLSLDAI